MQSKILRAYAALLVGTVAPVSFAKQSPPGKDSYLVWSDGSIERFRSGSEANKGYGSRSDINATVRVGNLTWLITYDDIATNSGFGFADPSLGADRRAAFEDAVRIVSEALGATKIARLQVVVSRSENVNSDKFASAGTFYATGTPAFRRGYLSSNIQTGTDPDQAAADMTVVFNFFHPFHLGKDSPPPTAYDMRSVAVHEITHALGMASVVGADGRSKLSKSNPGSFTAFDALLGKASGEPMTAAPGRFTGTPADLTGDINAATWRGTAAQAALGRLPRLFSPLQFKDGSSISHWSPRDPGSVMYPSIAKGQRRRLFSAVDIAMLRDLGYTNAITPIGRMLGFGAPQLFPAGSFVTSSTVTEFDDKPGPDLLVLESGASSVLRVYSNLNPATSYTYVLPANDFVRMSPAAVGPKSGPGVVIASISGERILSLVGLTLPTSRTFLRTSDFFDAHAVSGPQSGSTNPATADAAMTVGNVDNNGGDDVLTVSLKKGLLAFLNDGNGYFDRLQAQRRWPDLPTVTAPATDLTVFNNGAPFPYVEIPFGVPPRTTDIAFLDVTTGTATHKVRIGPFDGYNVRLLTRYGSTGIAAVRANSGEQGVARLRDVSASSYQVIDRWPETAPVNGIALAFNPEEAIYTTGQVVKRVGLGSGTPSLLAGSTAGYRDGPALMAQFNNPTSICTSGSTAYVIDTGNVVIRSVSLQTGEVATVAGVAGVRAQRDGAKGVGAFQMRGFTTGDDACAIIGQSLYLIDSAGINGPFALRKVNLMTGYVTTVPADQFPVAKFTRALRSYERKLFAIDDYNIIHLQSAEIQPQATSELRGASVRLGDVDRDGLPDALVQLLPGFRTINAYRNLGDGSFRLLNQVTFEAEPITFDVRQVDSGVTPDLVVTFDRSIRIFLGDGRGAFVEDPSRSVTLSSPAIWSEIRDVNNDGREDLSVMDSRGTLLVYAGNTAKRWGGGIGDSGEDYRADLGQTNLAWFQITSFNGDAYPDLLVRSNGLSGVTIIPGARAQ